MVCIRFQPERANRACTGFSLFELLIVLGVIAILSGIAIPRFTSAIQRQRLNAAAARVAADLNMAQSRANMTSSTLTVTFTFASSQYQIPGVPDLVKSLNPYTVTLADEPYRAKLTSTTFGGMTLTSGTSQISYGGFGLPSSNGSVTVAVGSASKVIAIDASGRATVQ